MDRETLATISTISAILPIIMGSIAFRRHKLVRWFVAVLVYGLLTDFINLMSDESVGIIPETAFALFIQNIYSLIDAVFFFWFLSNFIEHRRIRKAFIITSVCMIPLWIIASFVMKDVLINGQSLNGFYESGYELLLSAAASFVLIKISEQNRPAWTRDYFWLIIGIFFYNFNIFFLHSFVDFEMAQKIWFLGNLINIITMIFYSIGFAFIAFKKPEIKSYSTPS